ncbi:MAG: hypothetical protein R3B09_02065 [Nannocystaceae bacterium]
MPSQVTRLIMVTPFDSTLGDLDLAEQLVLLKGCVLCRITRDLEAGTTGPKPEWRACKAEIGAPVDVFTVDRAGPAILEVIGGKAPAVCAETDDGAIHQLLDEPALARCKGSVADFRGRLYYRVSALGLQL